MTIICPRDIDVCVWFCPSWKFCDYRRFSGSEKFFRGFFEVANLFEIFYTMIFIDKIVYFTSFH
jgi:hypothetical protein